MGSIEGNEGVNDAEIFLPPSDISTMVPKDAFTAVWCHYLDIMRRVEAAKRERDAARELYRETVQEWSAQIAARYERLSSVLVAHPAVVVKDDE
jgi:hypothetical protein